MAECQRCGRSESVGADVRKTPDGPLCIVCLDYLARKEGSSGSSDTDNCA